MSDREPIGSCIACGVELHEGDNAIPDSADNGYWCAACWAKEQELWHAFEAQVASGDFLIDDLKAQVSEGIISAMESQKVSRSDLSKALGITRQAVSEALNGTENMTLRTLVKYCAALNLQVEVRFKSSPSSVGGTNNPERSARSEVCIEPARPDLRSVSVRKGAVEPHNSPPRKLKKEKRRCLGNPTRKNPDATGNMRLPITRE